MAEIVSVATTFLEKLATKAYQEISLAWGLKDNVEMLQNSLRITSAYLMDAENKQAKQHSIREWLQQLEDAIYDAIDILDEMEYEAKGSEVVKTYGSATKKVCRFFSCSNPFAFRLKMAHKIKDIQVRIDQITTRGKKLGLAEQHVNSITLSEKLSWRETGSFATLPMSGRDEEKEKIISLLIGPPTPSQSQVSNIDVIPIVGIGGFGKTTLAQTVYNDNRVMKHFELRMWVCVSDEFDVKGLMLKIIKAADSTERGVDQNSSLDEVQSLLRKKLHEKRFLLVLDDVWNENAKKWHDLRNHLLGTVGKLKTNDSKIIVTTRSLKVASIMGTVPQIELEPLPEKECWELFVKCAFPAEEKEAEHSPGLKEIGKEIVKKCKGVPLAVVTLGYLLKSKLNDENEWKQVRDSELWKIEQEDGGILPALRLSYNHLPSHLKHCFSYCSLFPKDHEYIDFFLIAFWMAHGLLQPTNEKEEPEHIGELYIKELVSASFLKDETDLEVAVLGIKEFRMHDLVHDLAKSTMQSKRHLLIRNNGDGVHFPSNFNKIRTILWWEQAGTNTATELFVKWNPSQFKYLRVLELVGLDFRFLPDDFFAEMKHLRSLNLFHCTLSKKLPSSICKLYLLQTLFLIDCNELKELSKNTRNLISLRHLWIGGQFTNLSSTPIGSFKFLQTLMIVSCIELASLPCDIGRLTTLKKLWIVDCEKLASFEVEGNEGRKQNEVAQDLSLQSFVIDEAPKLIALPNWLKRSTKTLQCIQIKGTGLTALPEWLPNLTTLETLHIEDCPELLSLPSDMHHLRSLRHLYIHECPRLIARCKKDTGRDWPKIAHVPNLHLSEESEDEDEEEEEEEASVEEEASSVEEEAL